MQHGTPAREAIDVHNNQLHIFRFLDAAGDIPPMHTITIEQELVLECRSFDSALFMILACHYVYGISPQGKRCSLLLRCSAALI